MRRTLDGIAGGRAVTIEIKIPAGLNCRKCAAQLNNFGGYACALYGKWLRTHSYRKKGDKRGWPTGKAVEKCAECLNGSKMFVIGVEKR